MSDHYKEHTCDLCGLDQAVEVPYARLYTADQPIHICRGCGFVYVRRRRPAEEVAKAWSSELFGSVYTARIPAVKARQVYVAEFIDNALGLDGKHVMDIGAGEGQFLEMLGGYGAQAFGIEPSGANCQGMRARSLECFEGTIEEYVANPQAANADLLTVLWTLENCSSCEDMLVGARSLLRDGGHVVVATGSRILVPFKKALGDYLGPNPTDTHCFRFSANTLRGLLAKSGFLVTHVNRYRDTDCLCMIGQKMPLGTDIPWKGDDYLEVYDFFERWHRESVHYIGKDNTEEKG